jgi:hypothetical protein
VYIFKNYALASFAILALSSCSTNDDTDSVQTSTVDQSLLGGDYGGCAIYNSTCPNQPAYAGYWFGDSYNGANASSFQCAQRATDYRAWCGQTGNNDYTYSASIEQSTNARTYALAYAPVSGCAIWNDVCPNHPEYATTWFRDDYQGASSNEGRCLQRAVEYRDWCGTSKPGVDRTRAVYTSNGVYQDETSVGCRISIHGSCASYAGYSNATFGEPATNSAACERRTLDFANYCGVRADSQMRPNTSRPAFGKYKQSSCQPGDTSCYDKSSEFCYFYDFSYYASCGVMARGENEL